MRSGRLKSILRRIYGSGAANLQIIQKNPSVAMGHWVCLAFFCFPRRQLLPCWQKGGLPPLHPLLPQIYPAAQIILAFEKD